MYGLTENLRTEFYDNDPDGYAVLVRAANSGPETTEEFAEALEAETASYFHSLLPDNLSEFFSTAKDENVLLNLLWRELSDKDTGLVDWMYLAENYQKDFFREEGNTLKLIDWEE